MENFRKVLGIYEVKIKTNENNELVLDYRTSPYKSYILHISPWGKNVRWQGDSPLAYIDRLGVGYRDLINNKEASVWLDKIPREFIYRLAVFSAGFDALTLNALWLASKSRHAYELFISSPNLFGILLHQADMNSWTEDQVLKLVAEKRVRILEVCGLRAQKPVLRIIDKLKLDGFDQKLLNELRDIFNLDNYMVMNHIDNIDRYKIRMALNFNSLITKGYISRRLFREPYWQGGYDFITSLEFYIKFLPLTDTSLSNCCNCTGLNGVRKLATKYYYREEQYLQRKDLKEQMSYDNPVKYPAPPIMGNNHILPIVNSRELYDEERIMNNHATYFHYGKLQGLYFAYKVLSPERATLALSIGKEVKLYGLRLKGNKEASIETKEKVNKWLAAHIKKTEVIDRS